MNDIKIKPVEPVMAAAKPAMTQEEFLAWAIEEKQKVRCDTVALGNLTATVELLWRSGKLSEEGYRLYMNA